MKCSFKKRKKLKTHLGSRWENSVTNILLMNKENCALKLVDEIILYYDAWSKKRQMNRVASLDI